MSAQSLFLSDPLWYKDAVIYELHVRSFMDSTNDGYGDFAGLRQKLPYLERLGVNTLWLLPFLESPLRDDGYDTADYYKVLPVHGGLDDFKAFLDEAHERGMRVITELVLNHTSDQHPWFQESRDPNSPKHDWYVWSETDEKYQGVRIIFTDTEVSNWAWDKKAKKYYWHRFFSHQPDLNYDNPDVREAMKEVMFFWLDLGVDGLRLDAVPYLYEREGTSCENLPETIDYLVELREAVEDRYGPGKVLLAEANQWPEDTLPYFAGGKGVQMAFNFPIMPRMYMSLRRENRRPLMEMLEVTRDIPDEAQWAIFLRNHDELTLEMVTDEERDYLYHEYAADQRFRINVGIRRRLAPLLGGDRKQIELMNALLLSLPGSPILYYGDEIGMGDDPFLGDRNGVRTPMHWSPDKNGGFSRAAHHRLFMPAIHHGPYSYEFVNVEDAENNPHSLLHFTRRMLAFRRQHARVFGRGTMQSLNVKNEAVMAFIREYEGDSVLVVANLSRFAQSCFLPPIDELSGMVPVEMFSQSGFPVIAGEPYHLPLGPHRFYWFTLVPEEEARPGRELDPMASRADGDPARLPVIEVPEGLANILVRTMAAGGAMTHFEEILPQYMPRQRWYGAKERQIENVRIRDAVRIATEPVPIYLSLVDVHLDNGPATYFLPLTVTSGDDADELLEARPHAAVAWIDGPDGRSLLYDATAGPDFWVALFNWWRGGGRGRSLQGIYAGEVSVEMGGDAVEARLLSGEQSNSAAIVHLADESELFIKLYRRLEPGRNPEVELLEHLTRVGFRFVPQLFGTATFRRGEEAYSMGIVQEALAVTNDAWTFSVEKVRQFLNRVVEAAPPAVLELPETDGEYPAWLEEMAPEMIEVCRTLGVRTGEMHLALAEADESELRPEPGSAQDTARFVDRVRREADRTHEMLSAHSGRRDDLPADRDWSAVAARLEEIRGLEVTCDKIRIHGDFHLGQSIYAEGEFYLLDFEGEPARSIPERRQRDYAVRDVAGMLRSLSYATYAPLMEREHVDPDLETWADCLVQWSEKIFVDSYRRTVGDAPFALPDPEHRAFLWAYLLDKALYEVRYELNNRPDWLSLPLSGLRRLMHAPAPRPAPRS